jgi:hypothetical protein
LVVLLVFNLDITAMHYDITITTRYYGPTADNTRIKDGHVYATIGPYYTGSPQWKRPPHEFLAHQELEQWDADRVLAFTRRFGPLAPIKRRIGHHDSAPGDEVRIDVPRFDGMRQLLCEAWRGDKAAIEEISSGLSADLEVEFSAGGELRLVVRDLWSLVRLLFLRDYAAGKTKVCASSDCTCPYFLQVRRGQQFCSHKCAVLINVQRFRERERQANQQSSQETRGSRQ